MRLLKADDLPNLQSTRFLSTGNRKLSGVVPATSTIGLCTVGNGSAQSVCERPDPRASAHQRACGVCMRALCSLLQRSSIMQQTSLARHVTRRQWRSQPTANPAIIIAIRITSRNRFPIPRKSDFQGTEKRACVISFIVAQNIFQFSCKLGRGFLPEILQLGDLRNSLEAYAVHKYYRAMHACKAQYCYRKSSVSPSVTLRYCGHIGWVTSNVIARIISLGPLLLGTPTSRQSSPREHSQNSGNRGGSLFSVENMQYL